MWSRLTGPSGSAWGSDASGRQPRQALSTSPRLTRMSSDRYLEHSFKIHWISSSGAVGSVSASHCLSVVPTTVWPSQGRKKRKRPSDVL